MVHKKLVDNQFRSFHLGLNVMESNCFTIFEMLPNLCSLVDGSFSSCAPIYKAHPYLQLSLSWKGGWDTRSPSHGRGSKREAPSSPTPTFWGWKRAEQVDKDPVPIHTLASSHTHGFLSPNLFLNQGAMNFKNLRLQFPIQ